MTKTRKDTNIAPDMKNKRLMKIRKREKTVEKPAVSLPSTVNKIPKPSLSLNKRRKRVDATHKVRLSIVRLV
jgi:hypothetical protein